MLCDTTNTGCTSRKQCLPVSGRREPLNNMQRHSKRVTIIDETERCPGGMEEENLRDFVLEKTEEYNSTLVIVNTIACAVRVFQKLKDECMEGYEIFHLSNNMCPKHKLDTLEEIKRKLQNKAKKIICVSTQVVEAGVNFSFGCVVRSRAGLVM